MGALTAKHFRLCPECVEADLCRYGIGHWHVAHQIPAITRCPTHGALLHDRCRQCQGPLGHCRSYQLPSDPCERCQTTKSSTIATFSDGSAYRSFESMVLRALAGSAPELRPLPRARLIDRLIFHRVGKAGIAGVVRRFLDHWGAPDVASLAAALDCKVSESRLGSLMQGTAMGTSRALLAAWVSFVVDHATPGEIAECVEGSGWTADRAPDMFGGDQSLGASPELLRLLCARATAVGYPVQAARALATGMSPRSIANRRLASPNVTQRFLGSFDPSVQGACRPPQEAPQACTFEERIERARRRILDAIENGCTSRDAVRLAAYQPYRFAVKHDPAWFDSVLPRYVRCLSRTPEATLRQQFRQRILDATREGCRSRSDLKKTVSSAYAWAIHHDASWLSTVLPCCGRAVTQRRSSSS